MNKNLRLALLLFLFATAFPTVAQSPCQADAALARRLFEERSTVFRKADNLVEWLDLNNKFADCLNDLNQPLEAIEFIEQAVSTPFRVPRTNKEWEKMAESHNFQGYFAEKTLGDFVLAKIYYEKAWQIWSDHPYEDLKAAALTHRQFGNVLTRFGDYDRAEILLTKSEKLAIDAGLFTRAAKAASDLSIVHICKLDFPKAIKTVEDALLFPDIDLDTRIYLTANLSENYRLSNRLEDAQKANRRAFLLLSGIEDENTRLGLRESLFTDQAENFIAAKNFPGAEKALRQALFCAKKYYQNDDRREIGKIHIALGELYLKQKKGAAALDEFQLALHAVVKKFAETNPVFNPTTRQFYPENTIAEALAGKARAWQIVFEATGEKACLKKALACHDLRLEVETRLRETYQFESSSLQALDGSRDLLEQAVEIAWLLFDETKDKKYARRAFDFAERSKGLLLLQSLAKVKSDFNLPSELRAREQDLNRRIADIEKQIFEEKTVGQSDVSRLRNLESEQLKMKQAREKFMADLQKSQPVYSEMTRQLAFINAGEVPSILRDGQAMVEFLVGERSLFVFFFEKNDQFSFRKTPIPPDFTKKVEWLSDFLSTYDRSENARNRFIGLAQNFYELLLGPELRAVKNSISSLVVAPDGELGFIPFEVLLEPETGPEPEPFRWKNQPFLLKKFPVSYAWSATLLREQLQIKSPKGLRKLAGFAPAYPSDSTTRQPKTASRNAELAELPGAQAEIDLLGRLVGGDFFRNQKARKSDFLREAGRYRVLHLAMHANSNLENPAFSHLVFTSEPGSSADANHLNFNELQQIRLFAELAVLNACRTGAGKLHQGEGVFSLARAFALAGVPSTLMSLWELSDGSPSELMAVFYENLKAGKPKDESLRLAKLAWLDGSQPRDFEHPFFWSGLIANGKMDPIDLRPDFPIFAWAAGFGGLTALFLWLTARRKKEKLPSPASRF